MEPEEPIDLEMTFEVGEIIEGEEDDSDDSSDSEIDDGDLGDFDPEGEAPDEDSDAADDGPQPIAAYQYEPGPRPLEEQEDDEDNRWFIYRNRDATRLDPNNNGNWCQCGHCRVHPIFEVGDCTCCLEIPDVVEELRKLELDGTCITQVPSFNAAILDALTLFVAWQHFTPKWRKQAKSFGARNNEKYRYVAYRQFVRWIWGHLGRDVRVQLPACVQAAIKDAYPDGAGRYTGTVLRRLDPN